MSEPQYTDQYLRFVVEWSAARCQQSTITKQSKYCIDMLLSSRLLGPAVNRPNASITRWLTIGFLQSTAGGLARFFYFIVGQPLGLHDRAFSHL